jgi:hypothetical protein
MTHKEYLQRIATLAMALTLELTIISSFATQLRAESVNQSSGESLQSLLNINFKSPPNDGEPKQTATTGTRGKCYQDQGQRDRITPLLPVTQQGLTVADRPTFFVYLPATLAKMGEFVLVDKTDKTKPREIYYKTLPLSGISGIVSVNLPTELPPLEIGKDYQWSFTLLCNPDERSEDISVYGWVKRTVPNSTMIKARRNGTPLELATLYGEYGIWQDLLKTLADLRRTQPNNSNLATIWTQILNSDSVKLGKVSQEPLVDCCYVEN